VCTRRHDAQIIRAPCVRIRSVSSGGRGADVAGASESTAQPRVLMPLEACMQCSAQASRKGSPVSQPFDRAQQDVCQRWLSARTVVLSLVHIASAKSLQPRATRAFLCAGTNSGFHLRRDKLAHICAGTAAVRGTHAGLSTPSSATRLLSAKRWRSTCTHTRTSVTRTPARARARTHPTQKRTLEATAAAARGSERILG
jgi:hypothetical protein